MGRFPSRSSRTLHIAFKLNGEGFCTCPGFLYNQKCWHLSALSNSRLLGVGNLRIEELVSKCREIMSSLNNLNTLFGGSAYSTCEIMALYGLPNVGKTLLSLQEAMHLASQGVNVLYIDTEGSLASAYRAFGSAFRERFGEPRGIIEVELLKSLEELLYYLGFKVEVMLKGQKVEVQAEEVSGEPLIEKTVREGKIGFIVVDSITQPIRERFPSVQQNFPARADVTGMIYASLLRVQAKYGVGVLTTHHATFNPANPYETLADIRGGVAVLYANKRVVYLDRREKRGMEGIRRFWLVRGPGKQSWSDVAFARIDDKGYWDIEFSLDYLTEGEKSVILSGRGQPPRQKQSRRQ
jgi:RecA/RadA recombinase